MTKQSTLVSLKKSSTASVALPSHKRLADGAFGCFHRHAFPISHIHLA